MDDRKLILPLRVTIEFPPQPPSGAPPGDATLSAALRTAGITDWSQHAGLLVDTALIVKSGVTPPHKFTWVPFAVQVQIEDAGGDTTQSQGALYNNPLNLSDANGTITWPGQVGRYLNAFARFDTLEHGAEACAQNYLGQYYGAVINAWKGGNLNRLAEAIQFSPWDAGHYGGTFATQVDRVLWATGLKQLYGDH